MKLIYVGIGLIALGLGTVGVFVPGLPTTPFILLAATLFFKGSNRLYNWITTHRFFVKILQNVECFNWQILVRTLLIFWLMVLVTIFFLLSSIWWEIILIAFGFLKTGLLIFYYNKKKRFTDRTD